MAGKPVDVRVGAELEALRHAAKVAREVSTRTADLIVTDS
jgi:hypothetical protein